MDTRINAAPQPGRAEDAAARAGDATARETRGSYRGQTVEVTRDASSLMSDAAEELTFGAGEEVERKLPERREAEQRHGALLARVRLYTDKTGTLDKNEFEQLVKQLLLMERARSEDVAALTRRAFPDPTDAHAALLLARDEVDKRRDLTPARADALREALTRAAERLEETEGPAVRAGYNIAAVSPGELRESPAALRVLYRDTIIDFSSYEATFAAMNRRWTPDAFPRAVDFLLRALGADMAATTPSTSPAQLKTVMDGLHMVETLRTLHHDAEALLRRVETRHGPQTVDPSRIAHTLLSFRDLPMLEESRVLADMPFLISPDPVRDATLTQGVRELAAGLPHRAFPSSEQRQAMLDALQAVLEQAADREEQGAPS